jgi:pheophorbide a oxygenase
MIVLQGQEKIFQAKSSESSTDINTEYTKITFTPTQADRLVLAFRGWLRRFGNSQPDWFGFTDKQPLPSTVLSKHQVIFLKICCIGLLQYKIAEDPTLL